MKFRLMLLSIAVTAFFSVQALACGGCGCEKGDEDDDEPSQERHHRTQDKLRTLLKDGKLEDREIEIEVVQQGFPILDLMQPQPGMDAPDVNLGEMLQDFLPKRAKRRTVKVSSNRASSRSAATFVHPYWLSGLGGSDSRYGAASPAKTMSVDEKTRRAPQSPAASASTRVAFVLTHAAASGWA